MSHNFSRPIQSALKEAGQAELLTPFDWHPKDGPPGCAVPDAVVWDHETDRRAFFLVGYYRARGVPCVYVTDPAGHATRRFAQAAGCVVVQGPTGFAGWLATNPDYLRAKGQ